MGRQPHQHRKSTIVDAPHISALTTQQLEDVTKAATAHRPVELLDVTAGGGHIHIEAISADGRAAYGEWDLQLRDGTMFLRVVVDNILYTEALEEQVPLRWDRAMNGLKLWGKAVNAIELRRALSSQPEMAHLLADHLISPREYSPLGGVHAW
nr:MAG TPA: hypothetical protein [Caudoviricetes sp.]